MKACLPGHVIFYHMEKDETNTTLMHASALLKQRLYDAFLGCYNGNPF